MKKIISFLCMVTILCTVLIFVKPTEVSAASGWTGFTTTKGSYVTLSDGGRKLSGDCEITYSYVWRPQKYAIEFSAKVTKPSNSIGIQGKASSRRIGGYIRDGYFITMVGSHRVETPGSCDGAYHIYRLEVDHTNDTQTLYYDGANAGVMKLEEPATSAGYWVGDTYSFWTANGGEMELKEVSFTSLMNGQGAEFPADYTKAYFEEFDTLDYCRVPDGSNSQYFTHDADAGTVQIYREKIRSTSTYVEMPLRATKNFDLELRLKKIKVDESLNQGSFSVRIATDSRYTWITFDENVIEFKGYGENVSDPTYEGPAHCIPYNIGYDWFDLKAEVRDQWITWYVKKDGDTEYKEILHYRIFTSAMNIWQVGVGMTYATENLTGGFVMDWQKYTPDSEETFSVTSPAPNAVYNEGDDIQFSISASSGGLKNAKYYLNGFNVGTGNWYSGHKYTFADAKPGVYRFIAEYDGKKSTEIMFTVQHGYETASSQKITDDLGLAFKGTADNTWYTYKIVVGDFDGNKSFADNHDEIVKVYRKVRGAADSEYSELKAMTTENLYEADDLADVDYVYNTAFTTSPNMLYLGYYNARYNEDKDIEVETKFAIDNLQFAEELAYSGTVTNSDVEIYVDSVEDVEAVVLASYDENGCMVDAAFAELNGGENFADLNVKTGTVTKLFIWSNLTGGKPLLGAPIEIK